MIRYLLTLLILVQVGSLWAQQPAKVAKKYFPDPEMDIQTPWFQKGRKFTTYNEMMAYIRQLVSQHRSEERRVGKECISRWSPYH